MFGVLRVDEQMDIDEARLSGNGEAHLNVRKDELDVREPAGFLEPAHLHIVVRHVVVGYAYGTDWRILGFEGIEIATPGIVTLELVVEHGARAVDVGIPAVPLRASVEHCFVAPRTLSRCPSPDRRAKHRDTRLRPVALGRDLIA